MDLLFVLVHSPLVGPFTWSAVAGELRRQGVDVVVPALQDDQPPPAPLWQQHAASVAGALSNVTPTRSLVLVGHSGAGPLLPAVAEYAGRPVAAYLFVDAGIPIDGASRLDLLHQEDPSLAARLRAHLEAGGHFPEWTADDLAVILPDPSVRRALLAELCPRAGPFWDEPLPVFAGWPDAPCGYLRFTDGYAVPAERAWRAGWVYREMAAGHFHMLVDAPAVADALIDLAGALTRG